MDKSQFHIQETEKNSIYLCDFGCETKTGRKWFRSMSGQIDHYHKEHGVDPVTCLFDIKGKKNQFL